MNPTPRDISHDFFYKKKVIVIQKKIGYRFSVDAPILAHFLPYRPESRALEIGTGCGIISLLALYKKKFAHITGLEIQKELSQISKMNAEINQFSNKFTACHDDFNRAYHDFQGIDWIFTNPPYLRQTQGRVSLNQEIRIAKMEIQLTLDQILKKSFTILSDRGNLCLIFPHSRIDEFITLAKKIGFHIRRIQVVFSFVDSKPERFLIQLSKQMQSEKRIPPLILFKKRGVYTRQMEKILSGAD